MKKQLVICALIAVGVIGCAKTEVDHNAMAKAKTDSMNNMPMNNMPMGDMSTGNHSGMAQGSMEDRMKMMSASMTEHLGKADADYDHRFIDMMIPHHEGAIMMAKDALQKTQRPELKKLATEIIAAQQKEIELLKQWRDEWYKH